MSTKELEDTILTSIAEQATGCQDAGGYLRFARAQGYTHIEILNWCSSAGNWQFIVSKDGIEWQVLWQENNYPGAGFTRGIDDIVYFGNAGEVLDQIYALDQIYIEHS